MRAFNLSVAGIVASVFLFGSVGGVSAQGILEADPIGLQFEREVRSTYIVRLSSELRSQAVNNRANEVAARFGGRIKFVYTNTINGFAITMPSVAMANMLDAGGLGIESVTRDGIVSIYNEGRAPDTDKRRGPPFLPSDPPPPESVGTCAESVPWGVRRITRITTEIVNNVCVISDSNSRTLNYSTRKVCVIDTGVRTHPDLNVVAERFNFITDEDSDDLNGHGTHVAGIIGARFAGTTGLGLFGVAPNVKIVSVKVLNESGSGSYSGVIAGVDSIATGGTPICAVANMSLGGSNYQPLVDAVRCAAAETTTDQETLNCNVNAKPSGITFTIAAGNDSGRAKGHSPANASTGLNDNIHTIAAMAEGDEWAGFSNYGQPPVDYIEPGVSVFSTFLDGYKTLSGTSMAAPHMAGLVIRGLVNGGDTITHGGTVNRNKRDTYNIAVGY